MSVVWAAHVNPFRRLESIVPTRLVQALWWTFVLLFDLEFLRWIFVFVLVKYRFSLVQRWSWWSPLSSVEKENAMSTDDDKWLWDFSATLPQMRHWFLCIWWRHQSRTKQLRSTFWMPEAIAATQPSAVWRVIGKRKHQITASKILETKLLL